MRENEHIADFQQISDNETLNSTHPINNKFANFVIIREACKHLAQESVNELGKVASCGTIPGFSNWLNIRRNDFSITHSIANV